MVRVPDPEKRRSASPLRASRDVDESVERPTGAAPAAEIKPPPIPSPAGTPGVLEPLKRLYGMLPDDGADAPPPIEPDGFALAADSPLRREHDLLTAMLEKMVLWTSDFHSPNIKKLETGRAILALEPEAMGRMVLAATERHVHALLAPEAHHTEHRAGKLRHAWTGIMAALVKSRFEVGRDGLFDLFVYLSARLANERQEGEEIATDLIEQAEAEAARSPLTEGERYVLSLFRTAMRPGPALGAPSAEIERLTGLIGDGVIAYLTAGEAWSEAVNNDLVAPRDIATSGVGGAAPTRLDGDFGQAVRPVARARPEARGSHRRRRCSRSDAAVDADGRAGPDDREAAVLPRRYPGHRRCDERGECQRVAGAPLVDPGIAPPRRAGARDHRGGAIGLQEGAGYRPAGGEGRQCGDLRALRDGLDRRRRPTRDAQGARQVRHGAEGDREGVQHGRRGARPATRPDRGDGRPVLRPGGSRPAERVPGRAPRRADRHRLQRRAGVVRCQRQAAQVGAGQDQGRPQGRAEGAPAVAQGHPVDAAGPARPDRLDVPAPEDLALRGVARALSRSPAGRHDREAADLVHGRQAGVVRRRAGDRCSRCLHRARPDGRDRPLASRRARRRRDHGVAAEARGPGDHPAVQAGSSRGLSPDRRRAQHPDLFESLRGPHHPPAPVQRAAARPAAGRTSCG